MRYGRSPETIGQTFPYVARGNLSGLHGLGQEDFSYGEFDYTLGAPEAVEISVPDAGTGWNWQGLLSQGVQAAKDLYVAGQTVEAQKAIIEENLRRSKSGLPPLPSTAFQPQARVNVGMTPEVKQLAIAGLLGIGLLIAFSTATRKR